jgi:hypothetical protein
MPAGSPVSPECTEWFYRNVKRALWVATGSGGTDTCCGFVAGVPTLPVYAGEMQAPSLGVAARAFDEHGDSVVDRVGELVITEPMPSMPVRLWGDEDGRRYRETYFADYPGVWRHGDFRPPSRARRWRCRSATSCSACPRSGRRTVTPWPTLTPSTTSSPTPALSGTTSSPAQENPGRNR